jgi:hypothetical protein
MRPQYWHYECGALPIEATLAVYKTRFSLPSQFLLLATARNAGRRIEGTRWTGQRASGNPLTCSLWM